MSELSDSTAPVVIIDVDGVINVPLALGVTDGWMLREVLLDAGPEEVYVNPLAGDWLRELAAVTGAELAWGTLRGEFAALSIGPLLGLPDMPVAPVSVYEPKALHVVPWTMGRPFAWFDDLASECRLADELAGDQPHKMIQVDPRTGLTLQDVRSAARWLMSVAAAGWPAGS